MKKIQASQARAVVGGGFFKSLFKVSTLGLGGAIDPVTAGVIGSVAVGAQVLDQTFGEL
jgi:hypothetical protein